MNNHMVVRMKLRERDFSGGYLLLLAGLIFFIWAPVPAGASAKIKGSAFNSPQEAVKMLTTAVQKADTDALLVIFGDDARDIIFSGDKVESRSELSEFAEALADKHEVEMITPTLAQLTVGDEGWIFPIPIIKVDNEWYFDVAAGRDELLNRRIGANELSVIQVMLAYVNAQLEYASRDWDGDGIYEYAQKIKSDPGQKNGLYWPVAPGEKQSPFGPFIARAEREGYSADKDADSPEPYNGYYYKLLTRQGENAPGGAYDYVVDGNMILGFGMLAYPAKYGVSGIMTFVVNQEGVVYESDLGEKTAEIINRSVKYNPEEHIWRKVDEQYLESE